METKTIWYMIQGGFASFGGWAGWLLGGSDGFLYALIVFMVIDYVTGVMRAVVDKKLSSLIGFRGIFKKVLILILVGIGALLDRTVVGSGDTIRAIVIFFYISNEGISILENASRIGLPIPEKLRQLLQLIDKGDKK